MLLLLPSITMSGVIDKLYLWNAQILVEFCNLEPAQAEHFRNKHPDFVPQKWWDEEVIANNPEHVNQMDDVIKKQLKSGKRYSEVSDELWAKTKEMIDAEAPVEIRMKQWQVAQRRLREWWGSKFKDDITSLVILLDMIYDPDRDTNRARTWEHVLREILPRTWEPEKGKTIINREGNTITFQEGPVTSRLPLVPGVNFSNLRQGYIAMQGAIVWLFVNSWRARFCLVCHKPFVAAESRTKFCSQKCSDEAARRRHNEWARENANHHRLYMKDWRKKQKAKIRK